MKKKIGFVSLGSSTLSWLTEKLKDAPENAEGANELKEAIFDLLCGNSQALMLEHGEATETNIPEIPEITCGDLHIFPTARKVNKGKEEVPLTPKEFEILLFLVRNRGEVFTKEDIYKAVWQDEYDEYSMDDSNIMAFIRKLRKKIEEYPDNPKYIQTVWGIGYKFNDNL